MDKPSLYFWNLTLFAAADELNIHDCYVLTPGLGVCHLVTRSLGTPQLVHGWIPGTTQRTKIYHAHIIETLITCIPIALRIALRIAPRSYGDTALAEQLGQPYSELTL